MYEDNDRKTLKKLRKKKKSFAEVISKQKLSNLELDELMQEDF